MLGYGIRQSQGGMRRLYNLRARGLHHTALFLDAWHESSGNQGIAKHYP